MQKLSTGQIVDATARAVIENTDGVQLQVDIGHDQTALIRAWQVADSSTTYLVEVVRLV